MSLIFVLISSLCAAGVNLCLRKTSDGKRSSQGYLALYFFISLAIPFILGKVEFNSFSIIMSTAGLFTGSLNFIMMRFLARSLRLGPSGLSFAFQNSSCVLPPVILFFLFGSPFGFDLNVYSITGLSLIVLGLFVSSWMQKEGDPSHRKTFFKWIILAISVFLLQGLVLTLLQWRCLLTSFPESHALIPWTCSLEESTWFMPSFFIVPTLFQLFFFINEERRWLTSRETFLGITGGVLNGISMISLLFATQIASPSEKIILFPVMSVAIIFLCNLWAIFLYQEKVSWLGLIFCFLGILISSLF